MDDTELVRQSAIFGGLTDAQLERLVALAARQTVAEGGVVVEEDARGGACYLVLSGRVDIELRAPFSGPGPQKLATIKAGEVFGELSLVDRSLRSATARAVEEVELLAFDDAALERLMEEEPAIGYRIMRNVATVLAQRIRSSNMKLRNALTDIFYY